MQFTSISPIELAIPAPYALTSSPSLHAPNSTVYQYTAPSLAISSSEAPKDNSPMVCDMSQKVLSTNIGTWPMSSWTISGSGV